MEPNILSHIASRTGISSRQIAATADLLDSGATIPFISRYRKEATGCLDETQIQAIATAYEEAVETEKRRTFIIDAINSQGKLTDELKAKIESATDTTTLEDLYLPYKQKRRTRAEIAREKGLEPLAKIIMAQRNDRIRQAAERFVGKDVADSDTAIAGALDIIAEWVAENNAVRQSVRNTFAREAVITAKVVKGKEEEAIAFTNCPKVKVEARFLPDVTTETSGFREVCINAFPMPSNENDTSISSKFSPKMGKRREITVTSKDRSTVFFLPILFIRIPVGTEKMRNQKNTSDGNRLAVASLRLRSSFT